MWQIDKEFGFDYGHRVWSQKLNKEFATEEQKPVCRHLHGHRGTVHVFLQSDGLKSGMVTDFHHLNWLKKFLDDYVDHKFILDTNDPWFNNIINGQINKENRFLVRTPEPYTPGPRFLNITSIYVPETNHIVGRMLDTQHMSDGPEKEFLEGFLLVDFLPTSENLAHWLFECVQIKMDKIGVKVAKIEWFETPKSRSTYINETL